MNLITEITIDRGNNKKELVARMLTVPEIEDFMEKEVGILPNTCKIITPLILNNMEAILNEVAMKYVDSDHVGDFWAYGYDDALTEITKAVEIVNTTRKFGQTIYYASYFK